MKASEKLREDAGDVLSDGLKWADQRPVSEHHQIAVAAGFILEGQALLAELLEQILTRLKEE